MVGRIGIGNIVGVVVVIVMGGLGVLVWMCIMVILGLVIVFVEFILV